MERYPFIFSNATRYKVKRHLTFWFCWWLFQSFLYSFVAFANEIPFYYQLPISALEAILFMGCHMFLSYSLMYVVVPRYLLQGKYIKTIALVLLLFLATATLSSLIGLYVVRHIRNLVLPSTYNYPPHITMVNFYLALLAGLRGAITIGGLASAIKLMKYWYVKEQQNLELLKQNMAAQLDLLKAQVHPHFLFNTMNNIYADAQGKAPQAAKLVLGLSDMLRYMLYECDKDIVPLEKELKLLQDYVRLEQVRYDNNLDIMMELPEATEDFYIAPLLLLPFVENCFKHGTSQALENPWIHIHISIQGNHLSMKLANGKTSGSNRLQSHTGLGIANVKKRLDLLYPKSHKLQIFDEEDVFIVSLKLTLKQQKELKPVPSPALTPVAYA